MTMTHIMPTANRPAPGRARDRRRTPPRPRHRARPGRGRLGHRRPLPPFRARSDRDGGRHPRARTARRPAALRPGRRSGGAPAAGPRRRSAGPGDLHRQQRFVVRIRQRHHVFAGAARRAYEHESRCATLAGAGAARGDAGKQPGRRHQPARPETVQSQPGFFVVHAVESGAATPPPRCWRKRWRRRCASSAWRPASRWCRATRAKTVSRKPTRATPLGRSSTPQDIADAVVYAASARALTGTTLVVDGGQHLVPLARDVMFLTK